MKTITVDGCPLALRDEGTGTPIVFLHGFPLDRRMWDEQVAALTDYRRIAPDLRGFGASGVTPGTVTMDRFADDIAAVLDALDIPKAVICGLSMGGYVALAFWRKHAQRTRALVLCDTRAIPDTAEGAAGRKKTAAQVLAEGSRVVAEAMLPKLFAPSTIQARPDLAVEYKGRMAACRPAGVAAALLGMAERPDSTPTLATISVPTLVVVGEHDVISPAAEMQGIAEAIPGATFAKIPAAGHMAPLEQPAAVNAELTRFLERIR